MYKILPILLFTLLLTQVEKDKKSLYLIDDPKVIAFKMFLSDMKDTSYVPADYNSYIDYLKKVKENEINIKVNGLLDGEMFFVKTNFEIIDTAYCNEKSQCIPNQFSNIIVDTLNIVDISTFPASIKLVGDECRYDFSEYGSRSCDTAWEEYGLRCSVLESNYAWDCYGCNCPGDKNFNSYSYGQKIEDIPNCLHDCPGFEKISENSQRAEVCIWYETSWLENECINECKEDPEFISDMMGELTEMCNCPSQSWDEDDNCIYSTLNLDRSFLKKSERDCTSCENSFEIYGSNCCDSAWDEYNITCNELESEYHWDCSGCECPGDTSWGKGTCDAGYIDDCSGDGDCCPESWIGDGFNDCSHQPYGCDLSCYNNDYGDCHFLIPKIEEDYSKQGISIDLIYNEVVNKFPTPKFNSVNSHIEYGVITGKYNVNVFHEKGVHLVSYKNFVIDLIKSTDPSLFTCNDCISFISANMDSLRGINIKIKSAIALSRNDIYDNSWAVIIGIDKYQFSDPLHYAVKDAEAVRNMLINKFDYPEENIRYLTDEEATLSNIKLNLGEVATSAGENDRILVFYSGHGQTLIGTDNSEKGYIIPYEGKQDNPYATGIAMDEILTTSQISKSKHMLFLMDACYSGLMTEHVKGLQPQEEGYLTKVANEQARQIITAGGNEPAIEGGRWNHSVFTKNLLSGLDDWDADTDSDGYITADELGTYLRKQVTEDSNNQQTPQKGRFMNSGTGEFVFFSDVTVTLPSNNLYEEDEIISGCMDENANNYNPNATKPDRSCQYGQLVTSIEFGEIKKMNKVMGTDMKSRLEAIIPGGKTGKKFVEGYFEVPVIINNNSNIAGVQFEIEGGVILEASGGIVEENGFMTSHTESMVLSFSLKEGGVFPKGGNQVLIKLQIEPKDRDICIRNIVLASIDGEQMQSTSFDCFKP